MNEEITASMTYDAPSMMPALRWHNHRQNRINMIVGCVALGLFALSFFLAHFNPNAGGITAKPVIVLIPALTVVFVLLMRWLGAFLFARAIKNSSANGRSLTFRINDNGVKVQIANGQVEYGWGSLLRSLITPQGVLLYTQKRAFNWLPKTAFTTDSDYTCFLDRVTSKTRYTRLG